MMIVTVDTLAAEALLEHIEGLPDPATSGKLSAVFTAAFASAEARVHILSGSLKASGKESTDTHGSEWQGEMHWGGPSAPHKVDYAIYELARGGTHNWLGGMKEFNHSYEQIMRESV